MYKVYVVYVCSVFFFIESSTMIYFLMLQDGQEANKFQPTIFFRRLTNLKSLTLKYGVDTEIAYAMTLVFPEIGDANIPLRHLILLLADMRLHADFSVDGVTKLKIFEMLNLRRIVGLDSIHVEDICKHWLVLIELDLVLKHAATPDQILGMMRHVIKLHSLTFIEHVKTFTKYWIGREC